MSNQLTISFIQSDLHWQNRIANLKMFEEKISQIEQKSDLIILPEMFNSGFTMETVKVAEVMKSTTFTWMYEQAKQNQAVIIGSYIIQENNQYFNRLIWMSPDGSFTTYDKRHLFRMANEHQHFSAGQERLIQTLKGIRICPLICYDLRFPVWSRNTKNIDGSLDFDVLIYIANWPQARSSAWCNLLKSRAIENLAYCIGVNRVGTDGNNIAYSGDSAVIDFKGEELIHISAQESIETLTLDFDELAEYRGKFPAHFDADKFELLK